MLIADVAQGVPFAKVKHGNIIQFFDDDAKLHTAVKVSGEQCDGVLFLTDRPPSFSRATIVWVRDDMRPPWRQDIMLEYPDAMLLSKEFAQLSDGHRPETGSLTIHYDGTTMFLSKTYGSARYVDMKTGKTVPPDDVVLTSPVVVSRWAVVVPTGKATTSLVEFPEAPAIVRL